MRLKPPAWWRSGDSILAATGNMGRVYRLEDSLERSGVYEAPVHDASTVAQWGHIAWRADETGAGGISFRTQNRQLAEAG